MGDKMNLKDITYVVFDLETTGLNPLEGEEIIEIGAVKVKNNQVIDRFDELIKPSKPIPEKISLITNITNEMVQDKDSELNVLNDVLPDAIKLLKSKGRLVVITFHSLEDRIVKKTFKKYSEIDDIVKGMPNIPEAYKPMIKLINNKAIIASKEEIEENSRSKSAKLRIIERL